jgi:bacterioferritin-associated ferredoxin
MIVCICKSVSESHIRSAVRAGACHLRDLTRDLGVGTCCGKCVPEAKAALLAHLARESEVSSSGFFSPAPASFAV